MVNCIIIIMHLERYYGHLADVSGEYHKVELTPFGLEVIVCYSGCCRILMNHARDRLEKPGMKWATDNCLDQTVYIKMKEYIGEHGHNLLHYRIITYMKPRDVTFWKLTYPNSLAF